MKLYFIGCGEFVKVGLANDIDARIADLRVGNPYPLDLRAYRTIPATVARAVEKGVHTALAEHAHFGEWFRCDHRTATKLAQPIVNRWIARHNLLIREDKTERSRARARALDAWVEDRAEGLGA